MLGTNVSRRVTRALRDVYDGPGFKIQYAEAWTRERGNPVSKSTIARVINGEIKRLRRKTAYALAEFVEELTEGRTSAARLLSESSQDLRDANLRGADLSGEDFSGADLLKADLREADLSGADLNGACLAFADLEGANLSGVQGINADFRHANLRKVSLCSVNTRGWDLSCADMQGSHLDSFRVGGTMHAVDLRNASMCRIEWRRGGLASIGLLLPGWIDFSDWQWGNDSHAVISKVLLQAYPDDEEIAMAAEYILAQPQRFATTVPFPCWEGSVAMIRSRIPHRTQDILDAFDQFPALGLHGRWDVAELMLDHPSYEERLELRNHPLYLGYSQAINLGIWQARQEQRAMREAVTRVAI